MTATKKGVAAPPLLLGALIIFICGGLGWQVATRTLVHRYARTHPEWSLELVGGDPEAISVLSGQYLVGMHRKRDLAAAEATARQSLATAPLQLEGLRNVALVADARGQPVQAAAIMGRAARRGFRDVPTQAWLLQQAILGRDFGSAATRLDALLRTQPELSARVFPLMAALLNEPGVVEAFSKTLATNPPWRSTALSDLSERAHDIEPVVAIYQRLGRLAGAPTDEEAAALLGRMVKDGRYDEAYRLWKSFLPVPEQKKGRELVYDGRFKGLPGPAPFNWQIVELPGNVVETGTVAASRDSALSIRYSVANTALLARQLLALPPGMYRLSGRVRVAHPASGAALLWTVQCASAPPVGLTHISLRGDAVTDWTPFAATFTSTADCGGQWLILEGRAGDGFGDLSAWVTDVSIQPAPPSNTASVAAGVGVRRTDSGSDAAPP